VFGPSPLQPGPSDQNPAWVTAVTEPSSGQLVVPLDNWVGDDKIPPITRRSGESVTYQLRQVDGSSDLVAVVLGPYPAWAAVTANIGSVVLFLSMAAGGAFVFWHRPRDPAARVLLSLGAFGPLGMTEFPFGVQVIDLAGGRGVWPIWSVRCPIIRMGIGAAVHLGFPAAPSDFRQPAVADRWAIPIHVSSLRVVGARRAAVGAVGSRSA